MRAAWRRAPAAARGFAQRRPGLGLIQGQLEGGHAGRRGQVLASPGQLQRQPAGGDQQPAPPAEGEPAGQQPLDVAAAGPHGRDQRRRRRGRGGPAEPLHRPLDPVQGLWSHVAGLGPPGQLHGLEDRLGLGVGPGVGGLGGRVAGAGGGRSGLPLGVGRGPQGQEQPARPEGPVAAFDQVPWGADGGPLDGADVGAVEARRRTQAGLGEALEGAQVTQEGAEAGGGGRAGVERPCPGHRRPPLLPHANACECCANNQPSHPNLWTPAPGGVRFPDERSKGAHPTRRS